ncbi:hypothetical protein B7494_g6229 [Chlorociboria aeruginascens]|nr:hypothetical protein B7494_g6229 [Chlorociboria aeruginascens]
MAVSLDPISEPIPISLAAGRYLLFDINVVTYLRRTYHICGVLIGSIPQNPQQNVFLGLPVELLPEEARLLVEKEVAYIVDDTTWHKDRFSTLKGRDKEKYLESLRSEGLKAKRTMENEARKRSRTVLAKHAARKSRDKQSSHSNTKDSTPAPENLSILDEESSLFNDNRTSSPEPSTISTLAVPYAVTPTASYSPSSLPQTASQPRTPPVPSSYALFAHLHAREYFITPGLRFGCDYTVYPGDPLRFHSHFLAVGYEWEEEIPMLDIVGGGRLGTGVKKGFLIGGEKSDAEQKDNDNIRTFCIEWGGMSTMAASIVDNGARFDIGSWTTNWTSVNVTQYVPSAKDLALAGPRMFMKLGSLLAPEAVDGIFGVRMGQRIISEATGSMPGIVDAATTSAATAGARRVAQAGIDTLVEVDGPPTGFASRFLSDGFSLESARSFGSVVSYTTSKWALSCIVVAIVLNRCHIYASTRRNLTLPWKIRLILRITPIILLLTQARWLLLSIQCQTSPDFNVLRWGNASKTDELMFTHNGGFLHMISSTLLFGKSDADSCMAVNMVPRGELNKGSDDQENLAISHTLRADLTGSLSTVWPLFKTFCLSQLVETISCAVQGRPVAAETGMTLFELSLAFSEAESAVGAKLGWAAPSPKTISKSNSDNGEATRNAVTRSMIMKKVNTTPEVLLVGFLSAMNHITSHTLGILNIQGRFRLINTGFWGLSFMGVIMASILMFSTDEDIRNQSLLRFPTVCIIGFIPHILVLCGIVVCAAIYTTALLLSACAPPSNPEIRRASQSSFIQRVRDAHANMQANVPLSNIRITMHMDFYTALLKTGFSIMTMASEAVYLNESRSVNVMPRTWLEDERLQELEEIGAHWLGPSFRGNDTHFGGLPDTVGLVAVKDQPIDILRNSSSGYAREMTAQKVRKLRGHERINRDGVGAQERSGRWIMALEFFVGIGRLLINWWASIMLRSLAKMGLQVRPRWLLWLARSPKGDRLATQAKNKNDPNTLNFWLLSHDGELTLPKDDHVDVEQEMRQRLRNSQGFWNDEEEKKLDASLYGWWLGGGWFGADDNSGNFDLDLKELEDDTTSVVSFSTTTDDHDWESDDGNEDGRRTPTQRFPQHSSRESSPFVDTPFNSADLAQLLNPRTPEQLAQAHALSVHLSSERILTRSRYRHLTQREKSSSLDLDTCPSHRYGSYPPHK